jgi:hypothetical protein
VYMGSIQERSPIIFFLIGEIPYNIRRKMNKKWPETYVAGPLIQHITHNVKLARQAIDHQNLKQHQD